LGVAASGLVRQPADLPPSVTMITDWMRTEALSGADTVVHLSGEIAAKTAAEYQAANVETTRVVARALRPGQRVVFVSHLGADPTSTNLFLRAKGEAERLLTQSPAQAVILRTRSSPTRRRCRHPLSRRARH